MGAGVQRRATRQGEQTAPGPGRGGENRCCARNRSSLPSILTSTLAHFFPALLSPQLLYVPFPRGPKWTIPPHATGGGGGGGSRGDMDGNIHGGRREGGGGEEMGAPGWRNWWRAGDQRRVWGPNNDFPSRAAPKPLLPLSPAHAGSTWGLTGRPGTLEGATGAEGSELGEGKREHSPERPSIMSGVTDWEERGTPGLLPLAPAHHPRKLRNKVLNPLRPTSLFLSPTAGLARSGVGRNWLIPAPSGVKSAVREHFPTILTEFSPLSAHKEGMSKTARGGGRDPPPPPKEGVLGPGESTSFPPNARQGPPGA